MVSKRLEHDSEKWKPVFGKDHAQTKNPGLDPIELNWIKGVRVHCTLPEPRYQRNSVEFRVNGIATEFE